jgi:signal peptidase II
MRVRLFILISAVALFFDQFTKQLVQNVLQPYQFKPILGHFLRVTLVYNTHGIFGMRLFSSDISYFVLPLIGIAIVIFFAIRSTSYFSLVAYALIMGGAVGNLWDRVRTGKVIDFIDMGVKNFRWYTYNLADFYLVVGIIMILASEVVFAKPQPAPSKEPAPPQK